MADDKARKNSEEFKKNMQDADKASKSVDKNTESLNKRIAELEIQLTSITGKFKQLAKDSKNIDTKTLLDSVKSSSQQFTSLSKKFKTYLKDQEDGNLNEKNFQKDTIRFQAEKDALLGKEAILKDRLVTATEEEKEELIKGLQVIQDQKEELVEVDKIFEKIADKQKEINDKSAFLDKYAKFTEDIPILGKFFSNASSRATELRKQLGQGADDSAVMAANFSAMAETAGKLAMTAFFGFLTKGIGSTSERMTDLTRQFNISREESMRLNRSMVDFANSIPGLTTKELAASFISVSNSLGVITKLSNESARAFSNMTKNLGLSDDQANSLLLTSVSQGVELRDFNKNLAGSVSIFNATNETAVRFQDVMQDIADAGAATQLNTAKFPGGLEKAAYQARRFGMTLAGLNNASESLLSFEESISAELEAELLTGKQLNLERARAAALTGNQTMLAEELKKNIGDINDFQNQSVLAQNAQAKALGMSREELAEILMRQKAMAELSDVEGGSLEDKVRNELKRINLIKDETKREAALAKLREKTGAKQLIQQEQNRSIQQRMLEATEKIADAAGLMIAPFEYVAGVFDSFGQAAEGIFGFLGKIGGKLLLIGKFFYNALTYPAEVLNKLLYKAGGGIKGLLKIGSTTFGKAGLKSFLKKIPILGLAVGTYLGIKRWQSGDYLGALGEMGSGIASLFPGIGTAISAGIDATLLAGDMTGVTGTTKESRQALATKTLPKAATGLGMAVGMGPLGVGGFGSKFVLQKLGELIGVTKSSGDKIANAANKDIYMGAEKVTTSMAVSSIKNDG